MVGWWVLAFVVTLGVLRIGGGAGGRTMSGIVLIAIGVFVILTSLGRFDGGHAYYYGPAILPLLFGTWLVVKGALRFAY